MSDNLFEFDNARVSFEVWEKHDTNEIGFFAARRDDCVSFFMPQEIAADLYRALGSALGLSS